MIKTVCVQKSYTGFWTQTVYRRKCEQAFLKPEWTVKKPEDSAL